MSVAAAKPPSLRANFGWLLAERGWRVIVGLFVSLLITRHLGPEDFGVLSFVFSLSAIFGAIVGLGIDDVLARELVCRPQQARGLLKAGLRIKLSSAAGAIVLALIACWILRPGDWRVLGMAAWVTSGLFFLPADVVELWYQSREKMKAPALARQVALGLTALVRVAFVLGGAPVWCFAAAATLELALAASMFGLLWLREGGQAGAVSVDERELAGRLVREGLPLLASGFLVVLTMHSDRLLLMSLAGEKPAGLYAAAARMTELFYVIPVALGASFAPRLALLHEKDFAAYVRMARKAAGLLLLATAGIALAVSLSASLVIPLVLGDAYEATADVWVVHVWMLVFVALVSLRSRLWIIERRTKWILIISACTFVMGFAGNWWLIPRYGAQGAAWSAVAAWSVSALILPWCSKQTAASMRSLCGLAKLR